MNGVDLEHGGGHGYSRGVLARRKLGSPLLGTPTGRSSAPATGSLLMPAAAASTEAVHDLPGRRRLGDAYKNDLLAIMRRLKAGPVHLVGFSTAIALRSTLGDPGLVRSLTLIEPNVPWLLDGDPEGETVLMWWRDENARVRVEAAGDAERGAKLRFELVNNRARTRSTPNPSRCAGCGSDNFIARRPAAPSLEPLTCEQLGAITTPTLAVAAEYGMPYSRRIVDKLACVSPAAAWSSSLLSHFMSYQ